MRGRIHLPVCESLCVLLWYKNRREYMLLRFQSTIYGSFQSSFKVRLGTPTYIQMICHWVRKELKKMYLIGYNILPFYIQFLINVAADQWSDNWGGNWYENKVWEPLLYCYCSQVYLNSSFPGAPQCHRPLIYIFCSYCSKWDPMSYSICHVRRTVQEFTEKKQLNRQFLEIVSNVMSIIMQILLSAITRGHECKTFLWTFHIIAHYLETCSLHHWWCSLPMSSWLYQKTILTLLTWNSVELPIT